MAEFPSTESLEKSDDGSEFIYGGSVAINRHLGNFRDMAGHRDAPRYGLYLINLYTLVDNVYTKDIKVSDLENLLSTEIRLLTTYIEAYSSYFSTVTMKFKPTIIFYLPQYNIPEKFKRQIDPKTHKGKIKTFYDLVAKNVGRGIKEMPDTGESYRFMIPVGHGTYPHRDLAMSLPRLPSKVVHTGRGPIALFTHVTLDLHIGRLLSDVRLLQRYTGDTLSYSQFGSKLDKEGRVPFNVYTHRAFGDDLLLEPIAKRKVKKDLLDDAEKRRWMRLSAPEIANRIKEITGVSIEELGVLKI